MHDNLAFDNLAHEVDRQKSNWVLMEEHPLVRKVIYNAEQLCLRLIFHPHGLLG